MRFSFNKAVPPSHTESTSLSKDYRFLTPGQPGLKYRIRAYYGGTTITRNDAQIIALALNGILVLRGQGLAYWFSSFINNVDIPIIRG